MRRGRQRLRRAATGELVVWLAWLAWLQAGFPLHCYAPANMQAAAFGSFTRASLVAPATQICCCTASHPPQRAVPGVHVPAARTRYARCTRAVPGMPRGGVRYAESYIKREYLA